MKIGILTFHNAHNYGAVLQAYALRTKLRTMGFDTYIINYRNQKIENSYKEKLQVPREKFSLYHPRMMLINLKITIKRYLDVRCAQPYWKHRVFAFERFINEVLLEGNCKNISKESLKNLEIDVFICGSDQIWTSYLTGGLDEVYFLDFETKAKKVVYGASRFGIEFSGDEENFFESKLMNLYAISVREKSLAEKLSNICGRHIETVLDPTLLLTKEDYFCIEEKINITEDYVLAYFLVEDEMLMKCAEKVAELLRIKLIEIHYYKQRYKKDIQKKRKQIADCGPGQFLAYIKKARYVLTNSFHGVVFSVIYHKKFYAVYNEDNRKDDLLNQLQLQERHIFAETKIDISSDIDYFSSDKKLYEMRKKSILFLKNALQI